MNEETVYLVIGGMIFDGKAMLFGVFPTFEQAEARRQQLFTQADWYGFDYVRVVDAPMGVYVEHPL